MSQPELSVVVPVFNERDNVAPLVAEITAALRGRLPFEIVYIDDHSRDDTLAVLQAGELAAEDLRLAQNHLSEITGAFSPDDLLGRIFSSFCIGK